MFIDKYLSEQSSNLIKDFMCALKLCDWNYNIKYGKFPHSPQHGPLKKGIYLDMFIDTIPLYTQYWFFVEINNELTELCVHDYTAGKVDEILCQGTLEECIEHFKKNYI